MQCPSLDRFDAYDFDPIDADELTDGNAPIGAAIKDERPMMTRRGGSRATNKQANDHEQNADDVNSDDDNGAPARLPDKKNSGKDKNDSDNRNQAKLRKSTQERTSRMPKDHATCNCIRPQWNLRICFVFVMTCFEFQREVKSQSQ